MPILKSKWRMLFIIVSLLAIWAVLTIFAQREGSPHISIVGLEKSDKKALVVYNPDLFYNLDEQICISFAQGLARNGWVSKICTVAAAKESKNEPFDLYVFCANTYNWAPDRPTVNFIKSHQDLKGKSVVAITLGSGSTQRAKRKLENLIKKKGAELIGSETFWLMKPNDELRMEEPNTKVALDMAHVFGGTIAGKIKYKEN